MNPNIAMIVFLFSLLFFCGCAFNSDILKTKRVILRISSRDCVVCESFRKDWDLFKSKHKDDADMFIGDVFCEDDKSLCDEIGINSYPEIRINTGMSWFRFSKQHLTKNLEQLMNEIPAICRFPNNIGGCHYKTIEWTHDVLDQEWTHDVSEQSYANLKKEEKKVSNSLKKLATEMHTFAIKKQIIFEKKMYLESLTKEL